ncbi:MAG: hypothetical protein QXO15_03300 [Nitrososphaerota archaeon]
MAVAPRLRGWSAPWIYPTGLFIRDYLLEHKRAYPQEIWRALKKVRSEFGLHTCSYENFWRNYIYVLRKLGLIRPVGVIRPSHPKWFPRVLYEIVPGMEDHEAWAHPQIALDPRRGRPDFRKAYKRRQSPTI